MAYRSLRDSVVRNDFHYGTATPSGTQAARDRDKGSGRPDRGGREDKSGGREDKSGLSSTHPDRRPVLTALLAALGFLLIVFLVTSGSIEPLDRFLHKYFQDILERQPVWLIASLQDISSLGSISVLIVLCGVCAGFLLTQRNLYSCVFLLISTISGGLLVLLLKDLFDRPRPEFSHFSPYVFTTSFPSGHALGAALVYLTLGLMLARFARSVSASFYCLGVAIFLTLAIGITRVMLGVHYLSDVLAGWCAGTSWAISCWLLAAWLQERREERGNTDAGEQSDR